MRVAVLGMGRMGHAVAGRLLGGGHELVVWNRTPGRAQDLVDKGAREASSVAAAVSGAEVITTSLANDDAVRATACGDGGIRSAIADTAVYVDVSTISPDLTRELDQEFPRFAAMPILGSPAMVSEGKAVYLLGGQPKATTGVEPLLGSLGGPVRRYDSAALASAAKLTVNMMLLNDVVALAESFAVGRSGGLSDDQLRDLLGDNPMVPLGLKNRFEGILTGHQNPWWTTVLGAKDARLAVDLASAAGVELPESATARDRYQQAAQAGLADEDIAAVTKLYRR